MNPLQTEIDQALHELEQASFVAHRDARAVLPAIRPHGDEVVLAWLKACKVLFLHDRDGGKAFIRGSQAAEEVAEEVLPWVEQALHFIRWRGGWHALERFMAQLPDAYTVLGHGGERRWAELGMEWCEKHPDSGAAYFGIPVRELAGKLGVAGIEAVIAPADELYRFRRLPLAAYLPGAIRVRNLLGAQAIASWAKRGADILQSGRARGEAYFRLESEESLKLLMENIPGYRLPEHQRFLEFLLSIWFDEPIGIREGNWVPEQGRAFVESDGRSLYLPAALPDREEAVLAMLHAAGHIEFGSWERGHIEALFREAGVGYPPLDEDRRIDWEPLFAKYGDDALRFQLIFDLCEDLRVDWRINRVVPNHLRRMMQLAQSREPVPEPASAYYRFALASLKGAQGGESPDLAPAHRQALKELRPLLEDDATIVDAFAAADALHRETGLPRVSAPEEMQYAYLPGRGPNAARGVYPRGKPDDAGDKAGTREREPGAGEQDQALAQGREQIAEGAETCRQDPAAPPQHVGGMGGQAGAAVPRPAMVEGKAAGAVPHEKGFPYPEWDYRDQHYKRNWAWVQERELMEANLPEVIRLEGQYASVLGRLKRAIQAQKPTRIAPKRRQFDGDDIDLEAVVSFVTERIAGMAPKANVYRRRELQQRDTAVTLLADLSTSVMQQLPAGQGRVVDRIRAGILLFAESMEVVGDAYSIAGFSSKYRDNVSYYTIKGFHEPFTTGVKATIGGLSGRLATRMGAAIRHALKRFAEAPCQRRLLLILSDGRPEDYDDGGDIRYLHEDTRMAVKEAVDRGVHPFCITVDPAGSEYLARIFGKGHYLVLDHINSLPKKLPEIYLRLRR